MISRGQSPRDDIKVTKEPNENLHKIDRILAWISKSRGKGRTKKWRLSHAHHIVCIHSLVLFSLTPGELVFMFQDGMSPLAKAAGAERN